MAGNLDFCDRFADEMNIMTASRLDAAAITRTKAMSTKTMTTRAALYILIALCAAGCRCGDGKAEAEHGRQKSWPDALPPQERILYDLYAEKKCLGNMPEAMEYAEMLLGRIPDSVLLQTPDQKAAEMTASLADWYENDRYAFSSAIRYGEMAAAQFHSLGMAPEAARAEYRLARTYYKRGEYHKTLKLLNESLPTFMKESDTLHILDSWNILGVLNYLFKDYEASNRYFRQFLEGSREIGDSSRYAAALNNTALYSNTQRDSAKTRSLISESVEICRKIRDSALLCTICANITAERINARDFEDADRYFRMSRPLLTTPEEFGYWYMNSGISAILRHDSDAAVSDMRTAVSHFSKGEFNLQLRTCHLLLSELLAERGDTVGAYRELRLHRELEDAINSREMTSELYKFQNEIISRQEREQEIIRSKSTATLLTASVSGAVIIMILSLWAYRTKVRDAKEIRSKSEMVELLRMQRYQMDRLTENMVDRLNKARLETKDRFSREKISDICSELQHSRDESHWKEIATYIPELNSDFTKALTDRYPDLTANERRLCILLNMNLSTKEISELTRQSARSINTARTRLRSKLGLTGSSMSLQEFFSKIK